VKRLLSLAAGLLFAAAAHAGQIACNGSTLSFAPAQPWPYDTLVAEARIVAPNAGGVFVDSLPRAVGGRVTVEGDRIVVDIYGSDSGLPLSVPLLRTFTVVAVNEPVTLAVGPLAPGRYDLTLRVHNMDELGRDTPCFERLAFPPTATIRAAVGPVEMIHAVEYFSAALDHYFVTADAREIADLDGGRHAGWQRTGGTFTVFAAGKSGGTGAPVCRFYGLPSAGLDSHFYTANADECAEIEAKYPGAWQLETANAFEVWLPDAVAPHCDPGSSPILRLWNQRVDSNHRFTIDGNVLAQMLLRGYVMEGLGAPTPVSMCAPR